MDCETPDDKKDIKPLLSSDSEISDDRKDVKFPPDVKNVPETKAKIHHFQCSNCMLREQFDYFGKNPPYTRYYRLLEDCYVIEDPFLPPKRGEFIILGSNCISCGKSVCKDGECSLYYDGTYCAGCAERNFERFPQAIREKVKRFREKINSSQ